MELSLTAFGNALKAFDPIYSERVETKFIVIFIQGDFQLVIWKL